MSRRKNTRLPIPVKGGLRSQSQRTNVSRKWWSLRWMAHLESLQIGARLGRGRNYAATGQVGSLEIAPGEISAEVQGADTRGAYTCKISVPIPTESERKKIVEAIRNDPLTLAQLMVRTLPQNIAKFFEEAGYPLFPVQNGDLTMTCSCKDDAIPCKHIVAVLYIVIEAFDRDPSLLLAFRGISMDELIGGKAEKKKSAAERAAEKEKRNPDKISTIGFWGEIPDTAKIDFGPEPQQNAKLAPIVNRLGALPFWRSAERFLQSMEQIASRATHHCMSIWMGERIIRQARAKAVESARITSRIHTAHPEDWR